MNNWQPSDFHKDPMVNALLNIAEAVAYAGSQLGEVAAELNNLKDQHELDRTQLGADLSELSSSVEEAGRYISSALSDGSTIKE